jgi:hypothetical protein
MCCEAFSSFAGSVIAGTMPKSEVYREVLDTEAVVALKGPSLDARSICSAPEWHCAAAILADTTLLSRGVRPQLNTLDRSEQLGSIQRFLQKGRRSQAKAFGPHRGTAKRSQYDDRQRGENLMNGVNHRHPCHRRHP